jgi:Kef-type K+ transport system membrane component KefB
MTSTTLPPVAPAARPAWLAGGLYVLMLVGAVGAFLLIRHLGEGLIAPEAPPAAVSVAAPKAGQVDVVSHVLATLAAVVGLGFILGRLLARLGQPPVIGEVLAGILLGPSLLGAVAPEAMHWFVPDPDTDPKGQVTAALKAVSQLGVVLYVFLVGLELNAAKLKKQAHATVAISHASIVAPFVLGAALALWLYPLVSHRGVPFTSFALFLGAALSVTAFPVLARILADRGLDKTEVGVVALGCAAADDVTAWCLLALVVGVAQAQVAGAIMTAVWAVAFIAGMFLVVRPLAAWVCRKLDGLQPSPLAGEGGLRAERADRVRGSSDEFPSPGGEAPPLSPARGEGQERPLPAVAVPGLFVAVLLCGLATEAIGVHAVFGAFLLGAVIPHDSKLAREISRRLKDVVTVLLLPAFFALTGLRTEVGLLGDWQSWLVCGVIVLVATLGKWGGTLAAARFSGHDWRSAAALGAMMNTRGLMALIVLDVGLGIGVISPTLFAMLVLMALATTMATAPALRRLLPAVR